MIQKHKSSFKKNKDNKMMQKHKLLPQDPNWNAHGAMCGRSRGNKDAKVGFISFFSIFFFKNKDAKVGFLFFILFFALFKNKDAPDSFICFLFFYFILLPSSRTRVSFFFFLFVS